MPRPTKPVTWEPDLTLLAKYKCGNCDDCKKPKRLRDLMHIAGCVYCYECFRTHAMVNGARARAGGYEI